MTNALKHIESKIKSLERQLAACENKHIISQDDSNPFLLHKQRLIEQIEIARIKLDTELKKHHSKIQQQKGDREKVEPPEIIINRRLKEISREIAIIRSEMKGSGKRKSILKAALAAMQNQKAALKEKQKILLELNKKALLNHDHIPTSGRIDKSEKKRGLIVAKKPIAKPKLKTISNTVSLVHQSEKHYELTVGWEDLSFEDGSIKIRLDKRRFIRYPFYQSRSSYEYVKAYLVRKEINPLVLQIGNGRVRSITNLDLLNDAIQILKIQTEWNKNITKDNNGASASSIVESLGKLSPKAFDYFYRNKDLTPYLKELCNIQGLHYHLIPVLEPNNSKHAFSVEKESFLFTIQKTTSIYIVWESIEVNKATFVFTTNQADYFDDLQKIFDYISAHLDNKRTNLRRGVTHNEGQYLQSHRTFYHTTLEKWKARVFECLI